MLIWIVENYELIGTVLAGVHALAVLIVNLTPTPADNRILGKVYKTIEAFAGILTTAAKQPPSNRRVSEERGF